MLDSTPTGWTTTQLRSVVKNVTTKWSDSGAEAKYIGLEHISQGSGRLEGTGSSAEVVSAKNVFKKGDVLFGKLRPNLKKFWRAEFDGICSTDILVLRPQSQLTSSFLSYLVQSTPFLGLAMADAVGTKMPRTSWNRLGDFETALPPLLEQERIAKVLTSVDDSIRATEAVIAQAERVKRGLMEDLLTGGLGSEAIARGEVPEGWTAGTLADFALLQRGKFSARPRNDPKYYGGEIPFLQTGDVTNAPKYITSFSQTLNEDGLRVSKMFPAQTILMSIAANVGDVAILTFDAAMPDSVISITQNASVDRHFLFHLLRSQKSQLQALATQNAQANLNLDKLNRFKVCLPEPEEQARVAGVLNSVDDQIAESHKTIDQLQRLKRGLMDDLLTGRVRTV